VLWSLAAFGVIVNQVKDEQRQYDSTDRSGCFGGGPVIFDRRRQRKRSLCRSWYWPVFSGGSSSSEVFDVCSLFSTCYLHMHACNGVLTILAFARFFVFCVSVKVKLTVPLLCVCVHSAWEGRP